MDSDGVEGLFDTFLFLMILSVASCIILNSIPTLMSSEDFERRDKAIRYADSSLEAILSSTLPNASYLGYDGGKIGLANDSTVKEYLLDETYLVWKGRQLSSFDECNSRIERMIERLVTPAYRSSLVSSIDDGGGFRNIFALGDAWDSAGYSSTRLFYVNGVAATVSLILWWT